MHTWCMCVSSPSSHQGAFSGQPRAFGWIVDSLVAEAEPSPSGSVSGPQASSLLQCSQTAVQSDCPSLWLSSLSSVPLLPSFVPSSLERAHTFSTTDSTQVTCCLWLFPAEHPLRGQFDPRSACTEEDTVEPGECWRHPNTHRKLSFRTELHIFWSLNPYHDRETLKGLCNVVSRHTQGAQHLLCSHLCGKLRGGNIRLLFSPAHETHKIMSYPLLQVGCWAQHRPSTGGLALQCPGGRTGSYTVEQLGKAPKRR